MRRLWLPRRRWEGPETPGAEADISGFDELPVIGIVVVAIVVLLLALSVLPFLVLGLELLLLPALFAYRIALRKPWTVEARSEGGKRRRWQVVGWRRAGEEAGRIARALERGEEPAVG